MSRGVIGMVLGPNNREIHYGIGCSVSALFAAARRDSRFDLPRVGKPPSGDVEGFVFVPVRRPSVVLLWVRKIQRKDDAKILDYTGFLNTLIHEVTHVGQVLFSYTGLPFGEEEGSREPLACFIADTVERILWEVER